MELKMTTVITQLIGCDRCMLTFTMNNSSQQGLGLLFTSSSFVASSDASCLGDDGDEVAIT